MFASLDATGCVPRSWQHQLQGPNMAWLNNFKISIKLSLIVALMAIVTVGTVIFAAHKMKMADDAKTDIVSAAMAAPHRLLTPVRAKAG